MLFVSSTLKHVQHKFLKQSVNPKLLAKAVKLEDKHSAVPVQTVMDMF